MANENIGVYEPGQDISGRASAAITGKRFLKISGDRSNGNVAVAHADAGGRICGVSGRDTAVGKLVDVKRGKDRVTFVTAGANIAAFAEVQVGTNGQAIPKDTGVAVGYAVTAATSGGDAEISLY
ncbi:capsid cement protein [Rhodococcus sp. 11-3]|uniref:capsid cement protein n=1 Tax=Rhodococcus sp. 11-3 TaxID=2854796 RepID=UPI0020418A10|nr:capsid cement protein [Rhodococcus sp. 11-3]USC16219.1 DUF2190 family protein [Rhodococcus sp. 11-3]